MKRGLCIGLLCGLLLGAAWSVRAQDAPLIAPVQIEIAQGSMMAWLDCWPGAGWGDDASVYLNQPDGTARYSCAIVDAYDVAPVGSGRVIRIARTAVAP